MSTVYGQTEVTRDLMALRSARQHDLWCRGRGAARFRWLAQRDLDAGRGDSAHRMRLHRRAATAIMASAAPACPSGRCPCSKRPIHLAGWVCWSTSRRFPMSWSMPTISAALRCARSAHPAAAATMCRSMPAKTSATGAMIASGTSCGRASRRNWRQQLQTGAIARKIHRRVAQLCGRAAALRATVPRGRRRPYRAADRRQGAEPGTLRCCHAGRRT